MIFLKLWKKWNKLSQCRELNSGPFPYQGNALPLSYIGLKLSGRPGSNRRHSAWKADALPTELLPLLLVVVGRAGFEPAKVKPTDLQSVLVGRLSISPKSEPMEGLEPTTCWLQISCSSQLSYIGLFFSKKPPLKAECKCRYLFFQTKQIIFFFNLLKIMEN